MRLADLDPKLEGTMERGVLVFTCPLAKPGGHRLRIPIHPHPFAEVDGVKRWQASGAFPDSLTILPSINETHNDPETGALVRQCWHGFITNGDIR